MRTIGLDNIKGLNETKDIEKRIPYAFIMCQKTNFDLCLIPPWFTMTPHI